MFLLEWYFYGFIIAILYSLSLGIGEVYFKIENKNTLLAFLQYLYKLIGKMFLGKTVIYALPIWLITYPFSRWARNRVYNYTLQNGLYLERLLERTITRNPINDTYNIKPIHSKYDYGKNLMDIGYIKYRLVSNLEYILALSIWIWHNDDNNFDTTDETFSRKVFEGLHFTWLPKSISKYCDITYICKQDRKWFDCGDNRIDEFYWVSGILWNIRNAMYNFNYKYESIRPGNWNHFYKLFTFKFINFKFKIIEVKWHFGYLLRNGRMVWFTEDIDKI